MLLRMKNAFKIKNKDLTYLNLSKTKLKINFLIQIKQSLIHVHFRIKKGVLIKINFLYLRNKNNKTLKILSKNLSKKFGRKKLIIFQIQYKKWGMLKIIWVIFIINSKKLKK